jgi:16S rRNA C967 or C1407 C5-methylase (RsmB/RsmF family)/NOL1/NOP2/fmu family ribosome biogenesis protein
MIPSKVFLSSLNNCEGFSKDDFVEAHQQSAVVSVRANGVKLRYASTSPEAVLLSSETGIFSNQNLFGKIPWCNDAYYLKERPLFTLDPHIHAGAYYVQEASSMFIHHALNQVFQDQCGLKALDLCASPGGKTTLLASLPQFRLVLANEIIQSRVPALYENVVKWGGAHVFISNNDPRDLEKLGEMFDLVLVDAPCSGSGLFRKDEDAANSWTPDLVNFCSLRQRRIISDSLRLLSDNGIMVYSTCSFSTEENESNLDFMLSEFDLESVQIEIKQEWGIVESSSKEKNAYGYRFYPDKLKGEGFFCTILRKKSGGILSVPEPKFPKGKSFGQIHAAKKWVSPEIDLGYFSREKDVFAFEMINLTELTLFQEHLNLRKSGVRIGTMMRDDIIPEHELAMSTLYSKDLIQVNVNVEQAISYLRKEDMHLDIDVKGWVLITFQNIPLGWIKSLPGRINNYYPMNWRISMRK